MLDVELKINDLPKNKEEYYSDKFGYGVEYCYDDGREKEYSSIRMTKREAEELAHEANKQEHTYAAVVKL